MVSADDFRFIVQNKCSEIGNGFTYEIFSEEQESHKNSNVPFVILTSFGGQNTMAHGPSPSDPLQEKDCQLLIYFNT
jgi:hypothetical protein